MRWDEGAADPLLGREQSGMVLRLGPGGGPRKKPNAKGVLGAKPAHSWWGASLRPPHGSRWGSGATAVDYGHPHGAPEVTRPEAGAAPHAEASLGRRGAGGGKKGSEQGAGAPQLLQDAPTPGPGFPRVHGQVALMPSGQGGPRLPTGKAEERRGS